MAITLLFLQSSRSTQPSNAQFSKIGMSMYRGFATIFWLIISYAVAHVWADQGESPFAWGFNNKVDSITECQTFPIIIVPQSSTPNNVGVPPYYLFAFEAGGIPSVSMIGTDHNNLSWQNTHKRGTSLMLMVQDSQRSSGGVDAPLYNVVAGSDTSCLSAASNSAQSSVIASITPNVPGNIETCAPLGLTITGGKAPYTVIVTTTNSPNATNSSVSGDEAFTYINKVTPNEQLMASVVDADGIWGISSPAIKSYGSNDTDCPVFSSTPRSSSTLGKSTSPTLQTPSSPAETSPTHSNGALIIGVSVAAGVVLILGAVILLWWFFKRRSQRVRETWDSHHRDDHSVHPWQYAEPDMEEDNTTPRPLLASAVASRAIYSPLQGSSDDVTANVTSNAGTYSDREIEHSRSALGTSGHSMPSTASTTSLTTRERKVLEAHGQNMSQNPYNMSTLPPSSSLSPQNALIDASPNVYAPGDIVVQHQDSGTRVIHELPPPYVDLSGL